MTSCIKTLGDKGELVIPKDMRVENGIVPHGRVELISTKHGIFIVPLLKKISELAGMFGHLESSSDINKIILEMHLP